MPNLDSEDACFESREDYVPNNVTRLANLPPSDFTLIALAPWTSVNCTQAYLASARASPTRAVIFYLPEDDSDAPPPPHSPVWNLEDEGLWKLTNPYSVYAVSSSTGNQLMRQLSLYSGNMTSVPNGHAISAMPGGDPRSYVRLYTYIRISTPVRVLQMWISMLIIAAILVGLLSLISVAMKLVQRSRQKVQQQATNEVVTLDTLGIGHHATTQEHSERVTPLIYAQVLKAGVKVQLHSATSSSPVETGSSVTDSRGDQKTSHTPLLISEPSKRYVHIPSAN